MNKESWRGKGIKTEEQGKRKKMKIGRMKEKKKLKEK
jgi:hypothetical protein